MGARSAIVEDATSNTCQWLFSTPEYQSWCDKASYEKHHGFIWIRGKPGAGKSTAMKTLLNRAQSGQTGEKVLSFFFNARGEALERSTEGLYRSLLYQATASMSTLPSGATHGLDDISLEAYQRDGWPVGLLKSLIKKIVLQLDRGHRWSCYIDALDEGDDEDDIRDMVEYLDELTETANEQGLHFSVCLASRHYPNISVSCLEQLNLDDHTGHLQDIDTYVRRKAANRNATFPEDVVDSIMQRASGVFLWAVLVIAELKKHVDHGNHHKLQSVLDAIPNGVEKLLDGIVGKAGSDGRLVASILWASFALTPLTPKEFYTALMLSLGVLEPDSATWDNCINAIAVHNFIISASKGLLEIVAWPQVAQQHRPMYRLHPGFMSPLDELDAGQVQFIHESVREYFLHGGLQKVDSTLQERIWGICHERLTKWCSEYLGLMNCSNLTKILRPAFERREWWYLELEKRPLLDYAMDGVLRHAESAALHGSTQMPFGPKFPFEDWLNVRRCTERMKSTHPYHETRSPSLLIVLIHENYSNLVNIELSWSSNSPSKDVSAHLGADWPPRDFPFAERIDASRPAERHTATCIGGAIHIAVKQGSVRIALALIQSGADPNDHCPIAGSPLSIALRFGNHRVEMVTMLLKNGAEPEGGCTNQCRHPARGSLLYACAAHGEFVLAELLLRYGADPNVRDHWQRTPLPIAIDKCYADIVQVLLEYGADVNAMIPACSELRCNNSCLNAALDVKWFDPEEDGDSDPISLEIVKLLLQHGAIDSRCGTCKKTALDRAMRLRSGGQRLVDLLQGR
jgi:hypothetical protein